MRAQGISIKLYRSASIHSQFGSLERPYEESVGLGSYTDQKSVVLSKNEGEYSYQFYGRPLDDDDGGGGGGGGDGELQFSVCHYSSVFYVP